jgi:hypothetical protein
MKTETENVTSPTEITNTLTLTQNEKQVLIQLIDLAVKSGGLNVAEAALHLIKKLE